MLVLTRKVGEAIVIGGDIRVTLVEVRGGKVRIGIDAPAEVIVDRQEIRESRVQWAVDGADCPPPAVVGPS